MALDFGRSRLPEHLARINMTQAEFARRIGTTEGYVSQIISGTTKFSLLRAMIAANVLDCFVEDLYEWILVPSKGKGL